MIRSRDHSQHKADLNSGKKRLRKCKACGEKFEPFRSLETWCSPGCGVVVARERLAKQERKETKERKEALKTARDYVKDAQAAFNAFVRARDVNLPCISCGRPLAVEAVGGGFDCGHYRSVGSAPHLRFDERNAHGQCKQCNRYGAGRAVDYRIGLIARLGLADVEALEADQASRKYSKEELIGITKTYKAKKRELLASREQ